MWEFRGINRRTKGCLAPDRRGGCSARAQSNFSSSKALCNPVFIPADQLATATRGPADFPKSLQNLCNPCSLLRFSASKRWLGRFDQHHLLVHIFGRELSVVLYFQRGRPAPRVVTAEHAGVDQKHSVAKARPHAPALLHCVPDNNSLRI